MKNVAKKILAALSVVAIVAACVAVPLALKEGSEDDEANVSAASTFSAGGTSAQSSDAKTLSDPSGDDWASASGFVQTLSDPLESSEYVCEVCGGVMYAGTVEPTCLAEGFVACYCPACETWEKRDAIEPLGHDYSEKMVSATCTSYGYTLHTCSRCGASYRDEIVPNTGHSYEPKTYYPTCEGQGFVLWTCAGCGDSYMENIVEPTGHVYESFSVEESCETYGCDYLKCSVCGKVEIQEIRDPLGHDWEREVVPATDEGYGYTVFTCTRCQAREIGEIVPIGGETHDWYVSQVVEPGCESGGYTVYRCAVSGCDETYIDDFVPALGHEYALGGILMTRETFAVEVRCSRCLKAAEDVSISVSGGGKARTFEGPEADISAFSGDCEIAVYVSGAKLFSLDLTLEEIEGAEEEVEESDEILFVTEDGKLRVDFSGSDALAVYLVTEQGYVLTFPQGGEVDVSQYSLEGDIEVYVVSEDGDLLAREIFAASLFEADEQEDEQEDEKEGEPGAGGASDVEEGTNTGSNSGSDTGSDSDKNSNSKEDKETEGNGYLIAALVGLCVIAAAAIAWLVYRRVKGKKAPDAAKSGKGKDDEDDDWEEDLYDDGEVGEVGDKKEIEEDKEDDE